MDILFGVWGLRSLPFEATRLFALIADFGGIPNPQICDVDGGDLVPNQIEAEPKETVIEIASWNVNSIRVRLESVAAWLKARRPDVLLLQELKGTEFRADVFQELGYESAVVSQKAYNGVAVLSRTPLKTICTTLSGDEEDSHARFVEVIVKDIRVANVYLPNGNPVGTEKFAYKLVWMDRLEDQMKNWLLDSVPTVVGGDFNVIPEDIDCHKPASWVRDALFQPEPRARYRRLLALGYTDAF